MDREEAIEIVKKNYPHVSSSGTQFESALRELIPELKENEDEMIRKSLVEYFRKFKPKDMWDEMFSFGDVLSYLERQKESQPLVQDGEIEDKKRDIIAAIRKYYPKDYAEYLTSFLKGLSPEDNSEDEYGQKMLAIAYKLMYEHIPENLRTKEFWDSLKFMREYTGKVAIIHSYEQPAEWSEEDEEMLNSCISSIEESKENRYAYRENDGDTSYDREIAWLKSIRPQSKQEWTEKDDVMYGNLICILEGKMGVLPGGFKHYTDWLKSIRKKCTWKPTDKQMYCLSRASNRCVSIDDARTLTKLYEELEKFRA